MNMYSPLRSNIESFVKLTDKEWNLLVPHLKIRKLKKHEHFAEIGKTYNEMGFVLKGTLRHYYLKDGEEKTTSFYFENHLVAAYFSCITNQPSQLAIEALTDCELVVFPYDVLLKLYKKNVSWHEFGRLLAEYLVTSVEERMVGLLMLSPEERYLKLINGKKAKIIERMPQHYIANYLGITPVSLSRIRNRLKKK
jgi:CRP-like cAMP-binding protein